MGLGVAVCNGSVQMASVRPALFPRRKCAEDILPCASWLAAPSAQAAQGVLLPPFLLCKSPAPVSFKNSPLTLLSPLFLRLPVVGHSYFASDFPGMLLHLFFF